MQGQDRTEYVEFVSSRLPGLRGLAYTLCGDWNRADDIIQTSLTKAYLRWSSVRASRDVDQYVRAIVVNTFLSERRLAWSRVRLADLPPDMPAPEGASIEDRAVLRQALARLPKRQRAVLILRFIYDLGVSEVAETLHCSAGTVKSQTAHGLASLRRHLDDLAYPLPGRRM
ncbi:MAG TPA: SigE family RNA polymerase sigma factor [Micromonosporaceae bacterium]|nr:SigE family RNA polymerase sigma factor [Micromonosporaceae bacterium]